jgi:hypothetical protein
MAYRAPPEGALRYVVLTDFDFYHKNYTAVSACTTVILTTDLGCIAGAQTASTSYRQCHRAARIVSALKPA